MGASIEFARPDGKLAPQAAFNGTLWSSLHVLWTSPVHPFFAVFLPMIARSDPVTR